MHYYGMFCISLFRSNAENSISAYKSIKTILFGQIIRESKENVERVNT